MHPTNQWCYFTTGDVLSGSERGESLHLGVLQEWFGIHWWNARPYALLFVVVFVLLPLVLFRRVGVAIGCGSQGLVAIVNIFSYYLIGIPVGVLLAYAADLEVKGIWIGMMCGMVAQTIALLYLTWKIDWVQEVLKIQKAKEKQSSKS